MPFQAVTTSPSVKRSEAQERVTRPYGTTDPYGVGPTFQPVTPTLMRPDLMVADTIDLAEPATVTGFVCQGRVLGGFFRAALYDDVGGVPGDLLAEGGAGTISVGPNHRKAVLALSGGR